MEFLENKFEQNPWETISSQNIYQNNWIGVTEFQVINPAGNPGIYGVVHFKNLAIGVIPVDSEGNTWLVGQYRYPLKTYSWEIPEGGGDLEIDPQISAERELLEETGLVAKKYTQLIRMNLSNSVTDELAIIYLAQVLTQHAPEPEETEQLQIKKLPLKDVFKMVHSGEVADSMSVAALLKLELLLLKGEIKL